MLKGSNLLRDEAAEKVVAELRFEHRRRLERMPYHLVTALRHRQLISLPCDAMAIYSIRFCLHERASC